MAEPRAGSGADPREVPLPLSLRSFWLVFCTEVTDRAVYHSAILEVKLATPFPIEESLVT